MGKGSGKNGKSVDEAPTFVPLLNGAEGEQFVRLRQRRFEESWGLVDDRIQVRFLCRARKTDGFLAVILGRIRA